VAPHLQIHPVTSIYPSGTFLVLLSPSSLGTLSHSRLEVRGHQRDTHLLYEVEGKTPVRTQTGQMALSQSGIRGHGERMGVRSLGKDWWWSQRRRQEDLRELGALGASVTVTGTRATLL
jgi:hypothetical protein